MGVSLIAWQDLDQSNNRVIFVKDTETGTIWRYIQNVNTHSSGLNELMKGILANGGKLKLKAGLYRTSETITLPNNVELEGEGALSAIQLDPDVPAFTPVISIPSNYCKVRNLLIDGNKTNQSNSPQNGINIGGEFNEVSDNIIVNLTGVGVNVLGSNAIQNIVRDNLIMNNEQDGIKVSNDAVQTTIEGNILVSDGYNGVALTEVATDNAIVGNLMINIAQDGILLNNGPTDNTITGNVILAAGLNNPANPYQGININTDSGQPASERNIISNNVIMMSATHGILISGENYITITGNTVISSQQDGIKLQSAYYCVVSGNVLKQNGQQTNNTYYDIELNGSAFNLVFGNILNAPNGSSGPSTAYGVAETNYSNYNKIFMNNCNGQIQGSVLLIGGNSMQKYNYYYSTPSISANPPVSGTIYQNTNPFDIILMIPVYASTSGTAGSVAIYLGSSSPPSQVGTKYVNGATSSSATDFIELHIPAGWYYELTLSGATLGTATIIPVI